MECVAVLLTVCPHIICTPRPITTPTPYRKRKSHVIIMYPPQITVTTLTVFVKIPRSLHCLMSNATCFYFVGVLYSPVFTCSPRYLCPPRVPISQLTLFLLHCNKYYTTNTNNPPRHEGSVAGLGPVFIQFSAVRARPQPARLTTHYTLHLCQACRDVLWPRS